MAWHSDPVRWRFPAALAIVTSLALGACSSSASDSSQTHQVPLSSYVVAGSYGLARVAHDPALRSGQPGASAGQLGIAGAASSNCDGISEAALRHSGWERSYLRIWADRVVTPQLDLRLCVSQFDSPADAARAAGLTEESANRRMQSSLPPSFLLDPIGDIPHLWGTTQALGSAQSAAMAFAKGSFVVMVAGKNLPPGTALATSVPVRQVTSDEYQRLPSR